VARDLRVVRAQGVVRALAVARDRRVVLDVLRPAAQRLELLVHRDVGLVVARALRERALVQVQGGLARRHASERHRRVR
jgi:hypothetical protein